MANFNREYHRIKLMGHNNLGQSLAYMVEDLPDDMLASYPEQAYLSIRLAEDSTLGEVTVLEVTVDG